ncbi:N-alpha-acetyltransferase 30 isoform X1 [Latimeria chalumnae]|uniref:N-alpha-acetyltransferase 30 isoform X1 n=1 Tax=Latimeria chalumnae TaxID=7897 RepID=UPI0006D91C0B|nr:PREDICTED: N-alpha-acetyltransferase 30 [Latimeria chalumnae]|eukprot:XP_014341069.1 PREDICTED: N-alpha-acetyltransferase 30 [Latimeria chalumnae]
MANVPPGPSVLSPPRTEISPFPGAGIPLTGVRAQGDEEASPGPRRGQDCGRRGDPLAAQEAEGKPGATDGSKGHHHHHHHLLHHHQLNGLITPEFHYHKAASVKTELVSSEGNNNEGLQTGPSVPENNKASKIKEGLELGEGPNKFRNHVVNTRTALAGIPDKNGLDGGNDREEEEAAALTSSLAACDLKGSQTNDVGVLEEDGTIRYVRYESELQMPDIMRLITKDLSEPYSIYTYRYFIHNWPQLCFLAMVGDECVGAIVCKLDMHKKMFRRGYIAMLAVDSKYRRKGIGTNLVKKAIYAMVEGDCDEVVLETEITNKSALKLYENLGFVRDKRLFRYYLNGVDALRLKLWLR